jgi:hypothetical protein
MAVGWEARNFRPSTMKLPPLWAIAVFGAGLVAMLALAGTSVVYAQSGETNWQQYGWSRLGTLNVILFFDAAGIIRRDNGHVQVWTKALSAAALDHAINTDRKIFESAKQKVVQRYRPPITAVMELDSEKRTQVILDETAANFGSIEAANRVLYELDCTNRLLRELSIRLLVNGKLRSKDTPIEWRHVSPETVAADLLKLACTQH